MKGGVKAEVDGSSFVPQPPDYGANRSERKAPLEPRSFTELRVDRGNIFYL